MPHRAPFVFLSHSGADTEAARTLKGLLEANGPGLKVWFDKDDLRPGGQWQPQIEQAIAEDATAFVVYVGSRGVINWVDIEVRTALLRASEDKDFLFIPVLAAGVGANALPPFARLYHGVADPLGNGDGLDRLLKAVLKADWDKEERPLEEPFVGLPSMREEEADRFFSRNEEVEELVEKFRKHRLVVIVADSGTGKSSLAEAGFAPKFRGGALADFARAEPDDRVWHVVVMRPGAKPEEGLRTGVSEAAEKLGLSGSERSGLRNRIALDDPSETAFALQCDLPARTTATLLIVDQFEELLIQTPPALAAGFARLILALADGDKDIRILLTVRADYFNLVSGILDLSGKPALFDSLTADNNDAILRLKAMSALGVRDAVCKPLWLAGERDEAATAALLSAVQSDISHQASDLPLMQVALRAAWQEHKATGRPMLECYQSVGRVSGALAREADNALQRLSRDDQAMLESIFVRLVWLGDTGGATRRTAALDEFDAPRKSLLQRLGGDNYGRLVAVGERTAELSHEALITQWPWLHNSLTTKAADVRRLERLIGRSTEWEAAPDPAKKAYLAYGNDRDLFSKLDTARPGWLSPIEKRFLEASMDWKGQEQRKKWWVTWFLRGAGAAIVCALLVVGWLFFKERDATAEAVARTNEATKARQEAVEAARAAEKQKAVAEERAEEAIHEKKRADAGAAEVERQQELVVNELKDANWNASVALTSLAATEAPKQPAIAAKLALAAWPRGEKDLATSPRLSETLDVLGQVVPNLHERRIYKGHARSLNRDWTRLAASVGDNIVHVWDVETGREVVALEGHTDQVISTAFSPDGTRLVTASRDKTARVWNLVSGREIATLKGHQDWVISAQFCADSARVVTGSRDGTARLWDATSGREIGVLRSGIESLNWSLLLGPEAYVGVSPDGTRVLTASNDKIARVWDAASGRQVAELKGHQGEIGSIAFSSDGTRVITRSLDDTARVWDATSGREIAALHTQAGEFSFAAVIMSPNGKRIVTISYAFGAATARLWDAESRREIATLRGQDVESARLEGNEGEFFADKSPHNEVYFAAFSADGTRIVTTSSDGTARVWDATSGVEIATLEGHEGPVNFASFSPDARRIVTASSDGTARVWDARSGHQIATLRGHQQWVVAAAFSPDGTHLVTSAQDDTVRFWEPTFGRLLTELGGGGKEVASAAFSRDGRRVVTASGSSAQVWDVSTGRSILVLKGHEDKVNSASFAADGGRIFTSSADGTARIWDAASGNQIATFKVDAGTHCVAVSADGKRLVTASDKIARVWDVASGHEIIALEGHEGAIDTAAFSPDGGRVVTAAEDGTIRLWDVASGRFIGGFSVAEPALWMRPPGNWVLSVAFRADGNYVVATTSQGAVGLVDVPRGKGTRKLVNYKEGKNFSGTFSGVDSAAFSLDGSRLVTADGTAQIWDVASFEELAELEDPENEIRTAVFSPDGTRLLTTSSGGPARIWDVSSIPKGNILQVACALLRLHEDPVSLEGVTNFPRTFDRSICVTNPPQPLPLGEEEVKTAP